MEILKQIRYEPTQVTGGYTNQILRIDLSKLQINIQDLSPDFKNKYVGGRGYTLKLIWDGTDRESRYDSPENILAMASGPLGNEPGFPGTGKFIVGTISPLSDTFVDSNVGGHFGPLLKLAGFDALAVTGIASSDAIIVIDGDQRTISIMAAPVYDKETNEGSLSFGKKLLEDINNGEHSDSLAAVTAGKGALNARFGIINSLFFDRKRNRIRVKQAGRGGTGTVMRTKGLRGIVVRSSLSKANGNNAVDKEGVRRAGAKLREVISTADPKQLHLSAWGTTILSEYMNKFHLFPIMACSKSSENVELTRGPHAGQKVDIDGPEYETVGAVSCMGIFDPHFVLEYNWYCDEYGLDTISTGTTTAFFMECLERGFLTAEDIGYELTFGNIDAVDRLLHEIANGEGFGKIVGQGVVRGKKWVAEKYAARNGISQDDALAELNKFAMEVKGLEFSMYVTKESLAQQGGYGFALKGPQHDESWLIFIDQVHKELPTFKDKANALKWFPLIRTWFNATGLCKLPWIDVRNPEAARTDEPAKNIPTLTYYLDYLNATTGSSKTLQDILDDSERLYILQKLINLRHGKGTRISDQIPLRAMGPVYFNEYESRAEYYDGWLREQLNDSEIPAAPEKKHELLVAKRIEAYQQLCDVVYEEKGFSSDGIPKRETVEKFGLMDEQAEQLLREFGM